MDETSLVNRQPENSSTLADDHSSAADGPRPSDREVVITIDGPAGAGKSSVARALADRFGFEFLDTGAMYRSVTLACLRQEISWSDQEEIRRVAAEVDIRFDGRRVLLNGQDVSAEIRRP